MPGVFFVKSDIVVKWVRVNIARRLLVALFWLVLVVAFAVYQQDHWDNFLFSFSNWRGYIAFGFFTLVILLAVWWLVSGLVWLVRMERHPICVRMQKMGPLEVAVASLESELADTDLVKKFGNVVLTPSWVILRKFSAVEVVSLDHLVWVYPETKTEEDEGSIKKEYSVFFGERDGWAHWFPFKNTQMQQSFVQALVDKELPIILGYSSELKRIWDRDLSSRFVEYCEQQGLLPITKTGAHVSLVSHD